VTQDEISTKLANIIDEQFGPRSFAMKGAKNLQEALLCTSLEVVSFQMAIEDAFGLTFATAPADRSLIDEEWDALTGIAELSLLIEKWTTDPAEKAP
jgi:acyl carrier protein